MTSPVRGAGGSWRVDKYRLLLNVINLNGLCGEFYEKFACNVGVSTIAIVPGVLPSQLQQLTKLEILRLTDNPQLIGSYVHCE